LRVINYQLCWHEAKLGTKSCKNVNFIVFEGYQLNSSNSPPPGYDPLKKKGKKEQGKKRKKKKEEKIKKQ
jgi:hypothetical protein